jgi:hypothetical protein
MTLYELFRYTKQEIIEVEYLLDQAKKMNILDEVQEAFFQFSPKLIKNKIEGFGEHERWSYFHKDIIIAELSYHLIDQVIEDKYEREDWYSRHIEDEICTVFFLKTDMRKMEIEEINEKFKEFISELSGISG